MNAQEPWGDDAPRISGVFTRAKPRLNCSEILADVRAMVRKGVIAVVINASTESPVRAAIDPPRHDDEELIYSFAMRLVSWTKCSSYPRAPRVPTYLQDWLPFERAVIIPIQASNWVAGAIVVEASGMARVDIQQLKEYAEGVAGELAAQDWCERETTGVVRKSLPAVLKAG